MVFVSPSSACSACALCEVHCFLGCSRHKHRKKTALLVSQVPHFWTNLHGILYVHTLTQLAKVVFGVFPCGVWPVVWPRILMFEARLSMPGCDHDETRCAPV